MKSGIITTVNNQYQYGNSSKNTNYNGEVLEKILTVASTGNEFVDKGLIYVIPGVEKKMSLPRIKSGKMLQKRKENPQIEDSKGNFNYSEKSLDPVDFMALQCSIPVLLSTSGVSGNLKETLCLRNFPPKPRMSCWKN